jgi:hypothetical protein
MRARSVAESAGEARRAHQLVALFVGAMATAALAACGGAAPATMTGEATASVAPTDVPTPASTGAPTPVATPGPADGQTPGPITWDVREAPYRVSDVVSTGALLVAVGTAGSSAESGDVAGVWTSADGRTWEPAKVAQPAGTMAAVAAGPGRLVAVGTVEDGTSGPAAWTSVDGRTWEALPASTFAGSAGHEAGPLGDIATGPGGFVVVGSEVGAGGSRAAAWHSPDGLNWTRTRSDLGGDSAGAVVSHGSGYVAAGWSPGENGDDRALFWTSPDGLTWAAAPDAKDLHDVGSTPVLAAAGQHLVAFGGKSHAWVATEPIVWTSQDGVTWQREASSGVVVPLPSGPPLASDEPVTVGLRIGGLIGTDGGFVATGGAFPVGAAAGNAPGMSTTRRVVWTSPTGATWAIAADIPEAPAGPGSALSSVGPLVVHQGQLLMFGTERDQAGSAQLWATDLQGILDQRN